MVREFNKYLLQWRRKAAVLLFLVLCCLTVTVRNGYAEEEPTFILNQSIEGDHLVVMLSFTSGPCAAGTLKLYYNADVLELLSVEKIEAGIEVVNVNHVEGTQQIIVNFYNTYGPVEGDTRLAKMRFKIKKQPITGEELHENLYAESFRLYDINSQLLSDNNSTKLTAILMQSETVMEDTTLSDGKNASDVNDVDQETQGSQATDGSQITDDSRKTEDGQTTNDKQETNVDQKVEDKQETNSDQKADDGQEVGGSQETNDKQESGQKDDDLLSAGVDDPVKSEKTQDNAKHIVAGVVVIGLVLCLAGIAIVWNKKKKEQN